MPKNNSSDLRVQRTLASLKTALLELLHEKPLAKIQIKEITTRANVSRQVFYLHFDTKEDLLFSYIDDLFAQTHEAIFRSSTDRDTVHQESPVILAYQQWAKQAVAMQWVMQVENKDLFIARLRDSLAFLMAELAEHPDTTARKGPLHERTVDFIAGGTYMLLKHWMESGMKESPEEMGKLTYEIVRTLPDAIG